MSSQPSPSQPLVSLPSTSLPSGKYHDLDSILKAIADVYSSLTPQLKKAADYVLDNAIDIALLPIRKSSDAAGVTPSTMTRLAKTLGFERYNAFKDVFKQAVQTKAPINYGNRAERLQESCDVRSSSKVFQEFAESTFHNLEHLFNAETLIKLQNAAQRILHAKHVYVLGFRDAFACAHHFAYIGRIALPNMSLIRGNEGCLLTELTKIQSGDVVVAFGSEPYSMEMVNALAIAKEQGAQLISITDDLRSPLAAGADDVFILETETPHFFPTILTSIALVEALVSECVTLGGREMLLNINRFEKDMRRLGGYYQES
ncbi:MurR/RpiR family transcriptional regulator [Marinomonas sp. A79]|uniref:MurR/RpiR family transcriptional regulator n=1 Tax=Marinomonas vulgaris TaxID=2823372 RepID=A0ABS5H7W0_9GAMM|nr:MurR/RpiR family transcriptional regulator [Marinomonas vulgaris]MBR7887645.1 MurR/RpiR family transcriptional regulator [Marinomonas vulgaris]